MLYHNFDAVIDRKHTQCKKWDTYGEDVIPMWIADTDFKCPEPIIKAVKKRAEHEIYGYPCIDRSYEKAVCHWQKCRFGWDVQQGWVEYTPAVVPAIVYAMKAFTNPGDNILVQMPAYHPFHQVIPHNGRYIMPNLLIENTDGSWSINWKDLAEKLAKPRTTMFLLCNPHNPTGRCFTRKELEKINDLCIKNHVFVVSDEIHSDIIYKGFTHIPFGSISQSAADNSIVCINPSKTFNIAGFRTGAVIIPNRNNHDRFYSELENLKAFGRNIFGTLAVQTAYTECGYYADQLMEYLQNNLEYTQVFLKENIPQIKLGQVQATYLLWLDCRDLHMEHDKLMEFFLKKAKVALNDGNTFGPGGDKFMRFNIACPKSQLQEALKRMADAVQNLTKEGMDNA
ncbi:MalY/PatB family protein [Pectinatus sottacetonis]|uniref:MalY/PatB family protein n=1 Tax=Pectinatus sottacetonis TaxID=1002795 RepID=UPI0018C55FE2|nr:MalY/PatB family protein [Pectinatus sottacetonis]